MTNDTRRDAGRPRRRSSDTFLEIYVSHHAPIVAAKKLLKKLIKDYDLEEDEAVQVINCMPQNIDELRVFLAGGRKIIETAKLEAIVTLLNENRVN